MARFLKKRDQVKGQSPGALIFVGNQKMETVKIRVIDYDHEHLADKELTDIRDGSHFQKTDTVTWINFNGVHDMNVISQVGEGFNLHPLVLEDIMNTGQRSKIEEFDDYVFIVLKMIRFNKETGMVYNEQLSMILGDKYLLTFQEQTGDVFEPVRDRIRKQKSRIRGSGTDYLAYALIDSLVDNYMILIERLGEKIEELEEVILEGNDPSIMGKINSYMREINYLKKTVRPVRDAIHEIPRLEGGHFRESTLPFVKDLQDLITQAAEAIETYRDLLSDQLNIYNSVMGNKMNDIMKVLTIFASIFIPLTFIAGIYGTNFDYVPELHYRYSYFILWGVMIVIGIGLLGFFKRKNWL